MHCTSALILLWLLSAAALDLQLAAGQSHQSGLITVCRVNDPESLVRCLKNPKATSIVIEADVHAGAAFQKYAGTNSPLQVKRNVTIQGPPNRQPDDWPLLDFGLVGGAVQICSTCIMTLTKLVMTGERKGTGPVYDIFTGHPGSRVQSIDTYRLRLACTPPEMQLKSIQTMQRSVLYPNRTTPQDVDLRDVTYRGKVYPNSVWADYISFDVPYSYSEGSSSDEGGYAQTGQRSVRLCEGYVSKACLEKMTANACVYEMIDSLRSPPQRTGMAPGTAAAIAVSLSAGFLLAAGFAAWWWRRHLAQRKRDDSSKLSQAHKSSPLLRIGTGTSMTGSGSSGPHGSGGPIGKPLGRTTGWELMDSQTAPSYGAVQDGAIELGTFIGAGSFGKVFKGRWNGMDVAVKVIEHSGSSAESVQQEMEMMMSFQHKNIARAFHCLTYVHRDGPPESQYSGSVISAQGSGGGSVSFTRGQSSAGAFAVTRMGSTSGDAAAMQSDTGAGIGSTAAGGMLARQHSRSPVQEAAPTITEGVAYCQPANRPHSPLQAALAGVPAATASPDSTRVRFSDADSIDAVQHAAPLGLQRSGSTPAPGGKQPPAQATGSYGSSIDCKCVAADLKRSKSSQSHKEVSKRFESWLVLEYCDKGCVSHYLGQWPAPCEDAGDPSSLLRVLQLLRDAAQGLQELHAKKVVHGDLNARNVLVASCDDAPSGVTAKLADLGLSRSIKQHQTHRTTNTIGTMSHMPPEMLRLGQMSVFADVYALGIMMWELYTGEDAFQRLLHPGQFFETVVLQDLRPVIPQGMPLDYQLLMQHCWATEPSARPTISRVLDCLDHMLRERRQQLQGATAGTHAAGAGASGAAVAAQRGLVASDALPGLLASSLPRKQSWWRHQQLLKVQGSEASASPLATSNLPSQASSGALPGVAYPHSNSLLCQPTSYSRLHVLDIEQPADSSAPHHAPGQPNQSALGQAQQVQSSQRQVGQQRQLHQQPVHEEVPSGYTSQPLPAVHSSAGSNHGFSFFRSSSWRRRNLTNLPHADDRDGSVRASHESGTPRDSSSGRLPTFFQNLRQGSLSLRDASFESRHGSFGTRREGSQNDLKDHAWFV